MLKQIFAKIVTLFMLLFCAVPAWGLTLKVMRPGDSTPLEIALHATKRTEHALAVKMADGTIYYADMRPVDESFAGGMFARIDGQVYQVGVAPSTFSVTTTSGTDSFSFTMSAAGTFTVDWGDGMVQEIVRDNTTAETYSHTYVAAGKYIIGFEGKATGYGGTAISFRDNQNVAGIRGSLGAIFSTIGDGSGAGQQPMFQRTFNGCYNLTGELPENLFAGLRGQPVQFMFSLTFSSCLNLTGPIPENFFADISGTNRYVFHHTFSGTRITKIPENLFKGISGPVAEGLFASTFEATTITEIPENLFGDIYGAADYMFFERTFRGCSGLTGPSAKINGKYLYEIWPNPALSRVSGCYEGATGLSDYADIPDVWK